MRAYFPAWALVKRELLTTLRGGRTFLMFLLFVGGGAAYVMLSWPDSIDNFQVAGYLSRDIMRMFSILLFVSCVLFVPAFASGSIVLERERATYDFLRMSLIRPAGIVSAKMLNALGFFLLVLMGLAPIFGVSFLLVGIDSIEMLKVLAVVVATAFSCASVGLLSSSICRRGVLAIGVSYIGVIFLMLGPMIMAFLLGATLFFFTDVRSVFGFMEEVSIITSPMITILAILGGDWAQRIFSVIATTGVVPGSLVVKSLMYQGAFTILCLGLTLYRVRKPLAPMKVEEGKPIDDEKELHERRYGWPFYIIDPLRRKKPIEDKRNPMLTREVRWGLMNRGTILVRVFYVSFVVYFFAGAIASIDARSYETMGQWLLMQIMMTVLIAPALTANALTKEYELGNLDMLRMTLIHPRELIFGKLFAGFASLFPVLFAATLSCVPIIFIGVRSWSTLAMGYTTLFVCTFVSLSIALFSSLLTKRTTTSLVLSYCLSAIVFVGIDVAFNWMLRFIYSERLSIVLVSPIIAFTRNSISWGSVGADMYPSWGFLMVAWTLFASALIGVSVVIFHRYKMRDV